MNLTQVFQKRYSVRSFSERAVEKSKIDKILEAGRQAPTAKNFQPERIFVLKSPEAIAKIRAITRSAYDAPLVFLACGEPATAWVNPFNGRNAAEMDCSIVMTHMMLRATDLGLGSVWVCWFDTEAVKKAFDLPAGLEPYCLLPVGYPGEKAVPNPRHFERKSREEIVRFL